MKKSLAHLPKLKQDELKLIAGQIRKLSQPEMRAVKVCAKAEIERENS